MKAFTTPPLAQIDPASNINDLLEARVCRDPNLPMFEIHHDRWQVVSAGEFHNQVDALAKGLMAHGIQAGDAVAIMSRTRYEWTLIDFALLAIGAVSVPIYETSSLEQIRWIISDAGVVAAIVENARHAELLTQAAQQVPQMGTLWQIDGGDLDTLAAHGTQIADGELNARRRAATGDTLATIIYTSGTTGRPKGVELTHANFVSSIRNTIPKLAPICQVPGARYLMFLPLAHVFARMVQILAVASNAVIGHVPDTKNLVGDMQSFRPTFILGVPRVFEKVYNTAEQKAGGGITLKIFRWAAKVAIVYSRALQAGRPTVWLAIQRRVAGLLVYRKLFSTLGGRLDYAVSGGAPLGDRLGHFYRGVGLTVLEGYGLTETTAPTSVNTLEVTKVGTVGPPLPGTSARIADDGEIQVKGPHVFARYHNNPRATADAFDDGWFRTGDIGDMDRDGYLRITGRMKELIVTAGGKNVAPAVLEDRLRGHPLVSQCVVVGDQRPFVGALVTLDAEMLPGWLANHGKPPMSVGAARTDPDVLASLRRAVERTNRAVSRAESIREFRVLGTDFTETNGYLTPSLKVKRAKVLVDFAAEIAAIYSPNHRGVAPVAARPARRAV